MKDFNSNKDGKRPSASFVVGAVALLFLIVGYQAALFIHKASVARIIANHDKPDTVFVYAYENASQAVGVTANERPVASTSSATTQSDNHTPDASMFGEPCQTTGPATDRAGNRSPVAGPAEAASPYRKKAFWCTKHIRKGIWYRKQGFGVQKGKRFGQQLIPQELGALSSGRADQKKQHSKKVREFPLRSEHCQR